MALTGQAALAQNLFAPVARVNDSVVTEFEVQQRQRFLQLLNAPGSDRESVIESLIDDRLRSRWPSPRRALSCHRKRCRKGLNEFAARANLTTDEFVKALEQSGISRGDLSRFCHKFPGLAGVDPRVAISTA